MWKTNNLNIISTFWHIIYKISHQKIKCIKLSVAEAYWLMPDHDNLGITMSCVVINISFCLNLLQLLMGKHVPSVYYPLHLTLCSDFRAYCCNWCCMYACMLNFDFDRLQKMPRPCNNNGLYPQIRLLYGIKSKAAISLPFNLHHKSIAALFFIPYCCPIWGHCLIIIHTIIILITNVRAVFIAQS